MIVLRETVLCPFWKLKLQHRDIIATLIIKTYLLQVLQLPEILCIHLKRFRHELMFSSKISSAVSFPLRGLDMRPYLHTECASHVTNYELFSVICHHGTAGGGHYTCYALNTGQWYEFDDQCVTHVSAETVQSCEAYVLFYRKVTTDMVATKMNFADLLKTDTSRELFYISKQWISRFNTCAEPGPIDNTDFLCQHNCIIPERASTLNQLVVCLPKLVYNYLYKKFGGCPPICPTICQTCSDLQKRLEYERDKFIELNLIFQNKNPPTTHLLSRAWHALWLNYVQRKTNDPPGPIDNTNAVQNLSNVNEEFAEINEDLWRFFHSIYGGGPEIRLRNSDLEPMERDDVPDVNLTSDCKTSNPSTENVSNDDVCRRKTVGQNESVHNGMYCHGEPVDVSNFNKLYVNEIDEGDEKNVSRIEENHMNSSNNYINTNGTLSSTSVTDEETESNDTYVEETKYVRKYRRRKINQVN